MANTIETMTDQEILRGLVSDTLTELTDDRATYIKRDRLRSMSNLKRLRLYNLTSISNGDYDNYYFRYTRNCVAYLPKLKTIYSYTFYEGGSNTIIVPSADDITISDAFRGTTVPNSDFGKNCNSLGSRTFHSGTTRNIILRSETVVTASDATSIGTLVGNIYVPGNLVESYKTATNWSSRYASGDITFVPIEGSEYEFNYSDGTPIPTEEGD